MPTLIAEDVYLDIPEWVNDLASFRRWTDEPDFPEKGNIWWLRREVWADMSQEQLFTHNIVKTRMTTTVDTLVNEHDLGLFFSDGILLTNMDVGLSGNPDGLFVSHDSIDNGRVRLIEGKDGGYTEIQGAADMTLEVVSASSEEKDFFILREDYFRAGVKEYWLVDARQSPPSFEILRRAARGFVATKKFGPWVKSAVFRKSFSLIQTLDRRGNPKYRLDVR